MSGDSAVIDRIVDGIAVLVFDNSNATIEVLIADLPAGICEGQSVNVTQDHDTWRVERLEDETERRREHIRRKLDRLRNRPR